MYELAGLVNEWPAGSWPRESGGVPVGPSYSRDSLGVLVRLQWAEGRALWVPGHASRWNRSFVLVTVTPVEGDRRTETLLWLHRTDVVRALPAEPSTAPRPPDSRSLRDQRESHQRYPHGIPSLHAR
ncbi:hypothetical protein ACIG47_13355 [Promicromonospora sp. NPDC052451]|uniref:hypothetical protein n=1 Tax=Promicromonospora sp. NPDC052451 TaxID=3364407 RepID=UPI0037C8196C